MSTIYAKLKCVDQKGKKQDLTRMALT